jgi:hypothetical protein
MNEPDENNEFTIQLRGRKNKQFSKNNLAS